MLGIKTADLIHDRRAAPLRMGGYLLHLLRRNLTHSLRRDALTRAFGQIIQPWNIRHRGNWSRRFNSRPLHAVCNRSGFSQMPGALAEALARHEEQTRARVSS